MCGIVGLHLKTPRFQSQFGSMLAEMLTCMSTRGPDSAGVALYDNPLPAGQLRFTVRLPDEADPYRVASRCAEALGGPVDVETVYPRCVAFLATGTGSAINAALATVEPGAIVVGYGRSVEAFKDVGHPQAVSERFGTAARRGYQGLGHTRLATESAVTMDHSHPFVSAADLAVIHNGSFSNYNTIRRKLVRAGVEFVTDNDTEVCARYLAQCMAEGADLEDALKLMMKDLDGFYTLIVTTADQFAVVRDEFSCKPAVIAETDDYVAVGSEYHALASLPDEGKATVFEPKPEEVHIWGR